MISLCDHTQLRALSPVRISGSILLTQGFVSKLSYLLLYAIGVFMVDCYAALLRPSAVDNQEEAREGRMLPGVCGLNPMSGRMVGRNE